MWGTVGIGGFAAWFCGHKLISLNPSALNDNGRCTSCLVDLLIGQILSD